MYKIKAQTGAVTMWLFILLWFWSFFQVLWLLPRAIILRIWWYKQLDHEIDNSSGLTSFNSHVLPTYRIKILRKFVHYLSVKLITDVGKNKKKQARQYCSPTSAICQYYYFFSRVTNDNLSSTRVYSGNCHKLLIIINPQKQTVENRFPLKIIYEITNFYSLKYNTKQNYFCN